MYKPLAFSRISNEVKNQSPVPDQSLEYPADRRVELQASRARSTAEQIKGQVKMGKSITLSIPHRLTQQEVRARIDRAISDAQTKFGAMASNLNAHWTNNHLEVSLSAMGQNISGRVDVEPDVVRVEIDLPALLGMFAGKFQQRIEDEGRRLLK